MSMFNGPAEHAANPPATWTVVKHGRSWNVTTADGTVIVPSRPSKAAALEDTRTGMYVKMYDELTRWYAGETKPGHKSYAETVAERQRLEARRLERARVTA